MEKIAELSALQLVLFTECYYDSRIKGGEMVKACSAHGEMNVFKVWLESLREETILKM